MKSRRGERREGRGRRERRQEEKRRKCETVCRLCASLPLGSNLGPHSTQEGETPRIQQSSVLDSGAPATHEESTKTSDRNVTECCTESYERKKETVGGGKGGGDSRRGKGGGDSRRGKGGGESQERRERWYIHRHTTHFAGSQD